MSTQRVGNRRRAWVLGVGVALAGLVASSLASAAPEPGADPGSSPAPATATATLAAAAPVVQPPSPVTPIVAERGRISLSVDATGTTGASSVVEVDKPDAAATVRAAYLAVASTGFTGYLPVDGDIELDGQVVEFDPNRFMATTIGSHNAWADVTDLVDDVLDAAPAGRTGITVGESSSFVIDGSILAVIFDDPSQTEDVTVVLAYGAQEVTGDQIGIVRDANVPPEAVSVELGLGISFGFQPTLQYSTVDVNGVRLTSSAGGQDDGAGANGALITVGGLDDDPANPADPLALGNQPTCPRCDDELYDLASFLDADGTTDLVLSTANPSADDNVLFAALEVVGADATWVGSTAPLTFTMNQVIGCDEESGPIDPVKCPGGGPDGIGLGEYRAEVTIDGQSTGIIGGDRTDEGDFNDREFFSVTRVVRGPTVDVHVRVFDDDVNADDPIDVHPDDDVTELDITVDLVAGTWTIDGVPGVNRHFTRGDGDTEHFGNGGHPAVFTFDISTLQPSSQRNATFGDRDGDGLLDGWERFGLTVVDVGADNPVTAAAIPVSVVIPPNPVVDVDVQDLLVENDWVRGAPPVYSFDPGESTYADIVASFAAAPTPINLWFDTGDLTTGGPVPRDGRSDLDATSPEFGVDLRGGNEIVLDTGDLAGVTEVCGVGDSEFYDVKEVHFDINRRWVYRYAITGSSRVYSSTTSCGRGGQAEIGGNDILNLRGDANVMMHELGHSVTLRHGGDENENCKTNYLSVMNYSYDRGVGIELNGGARLLDYSPARRPAAGTRPPVLPDVDENEVDELPFQVGNTEHVYYYADTNGDAQSVLASVAPDLNADGDRDDVDVRVNLSRNPDIDACSGDSDFEVLRDHDDWSVVSAAFRQFGDSADSALNPSDDDGLVEFEEELLAIRLAAGRADLSLTGSADVDVENEQATISASLVALDEDFVNAPIVEVFIEGVTIVDLPAGCTATADGMRCAVAPSLLSPSGAVPTDAALLEFVVVPDGSGGATSVRLVATSLDNPVDNDPDPTNNELALDVEFATGPCSTAVPTLVGTDGNDVLTGTNGPDVIFGLDGDDVIDGLEGDDLLCGGGGEDVLSGGNGADVVDGGSGDDQLAGDNGTDTLLGGSGNDALSGGNGKDVLDGGSGDDDLQGENGADALDGGDGDDSVDGGRGTDSCVDGETVIACE